MNDLFTPGIGAVRSADIAVPEHDREVRFYARVLSTGADPLWREDDLANNLGIPVIGLGERTAEYAGLPLQWMPHIQVASVAESVQRALSRGASELLHSRDDDGTSQWAVLLDPGGAAFGLIPVVPAEAVPAAGGAATPAAIGRIAWLDLTTPAAARMRDFYRDVVGWAVQDIAMQDGGGHYADYAMLRPDGGPAAGVCHARGVNLGLPAAWMIYLPVGDFAESLRRVEDLGGTVVRLQRGEDGTPAYAAIRDPAGAHFAIVPGTA